ncbi:3-deoxy-D-manno-octulosonic acid transferase [Cognatiyoonia sp.]|uniref:3-deoxy-D-manno-octulosonic acid transferase n=1 Tax=Cognatiyoonia sp. TaxID=2211652 RepID=UPI003F694DCC
MDILLLLYRLLSPILVLLVILRTVIAIARGRESFADLKERLTGPNAVGPRVWVHAASVGELNAVRAALEHVAQTRKLLVTTTTTTGRETVERWQNLNISCGLAPLDLGWLTRWFVARNGITALIIVENELWPARILSLHDRRLPVLMLNARMSDATMRTWSRFPDTARRIFSDMATILPQDAQSADRFELLGAARDKLAEVINLKALYLPVDTPLPAAFAGLNRRKILLAAATHDPEDRYALKAFRALHETDKTLQLIIAPRHPQRGAAIAELTAEMAFDVSRRSQKDPFDRPVYIADTIGEMHIWYRIAGAAFIGGSLVNKGGHTPYEPAAHGCPIVHGPSISNFTDSYADVASHFPVWTIDGPKELSDAWAHALDRTPEPYRSDQSGQAVLDVLDHHLR